MWKITKNVIDLNQDHQASHDYKEGAVLPCRFKLFDDDGELYFEGIADEEDFSPLDEYAMPSYGCTAIQYRNPATKQYETL
jgi:hypothetical protein